MSNRLIPAERSVIIAADVAGNRFTSLVDETGDIGGISAYKLGFRVGYSRLSLPLAVEYIREHTNKKVIFDHQKAGCDIPETGPEFASAMEEAGIDAAILFPLTGPATQEVWTKALQDKGITVLVGSEMTHSKISWAEGGYISGLAFDKILGLAVKHGVRDFVVPGNKVDRVKHYRRFLEKELGGDFTLYAPGFIDQGGNVSETGQAAGDNWHAIIGRGICQAADVRAAAIELTSQIT